MKILRFFLTIDRGRILRLSCVVALVALGLIAWALLDPRPIPVIVAMSVAQALGTMSFAAFLFVVVRDLRPFASRPAGPGAPAISASETLAPAEAKSVSSE